MNMGSAMKAVGAWNTFKKNHPKFPAFLSAAASRGIREDSVIEVIVTTPEGEKIETSVKIKPEDMELFKSLSNL